MHGDIRSMRPKVKRVRTSTEGLLGRKPKKPKIQHTDAQKAVLYIRSSMEYVFRFVESKFYPEACVPVKEGESIGDPNTLVTTRTSLRFARRMMRLFKELKIAQEQITDDIESVLVVFKKYKSLFKALKYMNWEYTFLTDHEEITIGEFRKYADPVVDICDELTDEVFDKLSKFRIPRRVKEAVAKQKK